MAKSKFPPTVRTFNGKEYRIYGAKRDKMTTDKKTTEFWKRNLRSQHVLHRIIRHKMDGKNYYVLYMRLERKRLKKLYKPSTKKVTKGMKKSVAWLKAHPNLHNFKTYLKMTTDLRIRNIRVGRVRNDGTRSVRWEQEGRDGRWFDASASYLTDLGYPDGW